MDVVTCSSNVAANNSRARDELFAREIFDSVRQARFLYSE